MKVVTSYLGQYPQEPLTDFTAGSFRVNISVYLSAGSADVNGTVSVELPGLKLAASQRVFVPRGASAVACLSLVTPPGLYVGTVRSACVRACLYADIELVSDFTLPTCVGRSSGGRRTCSITTHRRHSLRTKCCPHSTPITAHR